MVKKKTVAVPDAWDDDWEAQADNGAPLNQDPEPEIEPPRTKAERLAQHVESNRKLWESADTRETFHFLETTNNVPLTSSFKSQVKVLSRKPMIAKRDPATGLSQMTLEDDGDNNTKEAQPTPEEIRAKQKRDREEKQRRYEEARAKIFGESAPSSGNSSPGTVTPPRSDGQQTPRARGRGGSRGGSNIHQRNNDNSRQFEGRRQVQQSGSSRELFDPNYASKPDSPSSQGGAEVASILRGYLRPRMSNKLRFDHQGDQTAVEEEVSALLGAAPKKLDF
uniref:SUZ domain-containing protein n=1 Tax=Bionectria ochroleuca TaxID=29856 RepID=A0A8H7TP37_BIOOC